MNPVTARAAAFAALAGGCAALALALLAPLSAEGREAAHRAVPAGDTAVSRDADTLVAVLLARNPFRLDRRLADPAYDPAHIGVAGPAVTIGPPKPALRLVGLIDGSPIAAIVDGLPGIEGGRVVRAGDTVGPLRVVRLTRQSVHITGLDTTWTLTLRMP